jgi:hypothetical protein
MALKWADNQNLQAIPRPELKGSKGEEGRCIRRLTDYERFTNGMAMRMGCTCGRCRAGTRLALKSATVHTNAPQFPKVGPKRVSPCEPFPSLPAEMKHEID